MGLADRDYMKRQGRNDPYYKRLFDPPSSAGHSSDRPWGAPAPFVGRGRRRRSLSTLLVFAGLTVFGLWVLPHIAIHGHHYRFWIL